MEFLDLFLDFVPRGEDTDRSEQRNQVDQENADAINTNVIVNVPLGDPGDELFEFKAAGAGMNVIDRNERQQEIRLLRRRD